MRCIELCPFNPAYSTTPSAAVLHAQHPLQLARYDAEATTRPSRAEASWRIAPWSLVPLAADGHAQCQDGEESTGYIGGKPAEVLPPVGAARLSGGARADAERRKSAADYSLTDRVKAVVRGRVHFAAYIAVGCAHQRRPLMTYQQDVSIPNNW